MRTTITNENNHFILEIEYEDGVLSDFTVYAKEYGLASDNLPYNEEDDTFGEDHLEACEHVYLRKEFIMSYHNNFNTLDNEEYEDYYVQQCLNSLYEIFKIHG